MRLDYAAFLELEVFARLGTRLEPATRRRIEIGRRIRALLRANRLVPLGVYEEVARLVLAAEPDLLLAIPESDIEEVSAWLVETVRRGLPGVAEVVDREALLSAADREAFVTSMRTAISTRFGALDVPRQ
jgi:F-type H+-transporting ATPase subunit alpha